MEDLPVGSEITLKVVEINKKSCSGCFFDDICSSIYDCVCRSFADGTPFGVKVEE